MPDQPVARDEQDLWIAQASKNVKKYAFFMRKAIVRHPTLLPFLCLLVEFKWEGCVKYLAKLIRNTFAG